MKASFQLLARYPELWHQDRCLIIVEEEQQGPCQLHLQGLKADYLPLQASTNTALTAQGISTHFTLDIRQSYDRIIIDLPKAKSLTQMLLSLAASLISDDGKILVVGENKGGIKSMPKLLEAAELTGQKLVSACHSALWQAKGHVHQPFDLEQWWHQYPVADLQIWALPGVFSQQKLDLGSQVLLSQLGDVKGKVYDFGCGCGVLGLSLLKTTPGIDLLMSDDSLLACMSATRSAEENELSASILCRDGLVDKQTGFDWIISNPPFHQGRSTHYDVARDFLTRAPRLLRLSGQIAIVANQFLAYEPILENGFLEQQELTREQGFKVLWAKKPKKLKK